MDITKEQIEKLRASYKANRSDLNKLKAYIRENGRTDNGLSDAYESFEQGYNNALEFVFSTIGIMC